MNRKGQALVEFVIILPIFLLLFMGAIDMGRIMYSKIILEEKMSDIINLYRNGKSNEDIKEELKLEEIKLEIKSDNEYLDFNLVKEIDVLTPGLNVILKNPHPLIIKRSIKNVT